MKKSPFVAVTSHRSPPLRFLPGIYVLTNQNLKLSINTKGEGTIDTPNKEQVFLSSHSIWTIKTIQSKYFFVFKTRIRDCDHLVMLFILYQNFFFAQFSLPSGKKRLTKQVTVSVNRHGHVQLKGNLEKKIALMKLKDIVQLEDTIGKKFWDVKFLK